MDCPKFLMIVYIKFREMWWSQPLAALSEKFGCFIVCEMFKGQVTMWFHTVVEIIWVGWFDVRCESKADETKKLYRNTLVYLVSFKFCNVH